MSQSDPQIVKTLFESVATLVRETTAPEASDENYRASSFNEEKLQLYGLYKHVVGGPCTGDQLPSIFQVVARSKYESWQACRSYTPQEAMMEYVQIVASKKDPLGQKCKELLEEFHREIEKSTETSGKDSDDPQNDDTTMKFVSNGEIPGTKGAELEKRFLVEHIQKEKGENSSGEKPHALPTSWLTYLFALVGVHPLIPRGLLDISYRDLCFAIYQSLRWKYSVRRCQLLNREICNLWREATGHEVAVGLSVRSLFDNYLSSKDYPSESEVIVFPPITVPGMMHVAKYHNIRLVPADIGESDWWNLETIKMAINKRTVAIMIVHPFGTLSVSPKQFEELRRLSDMHGLEIWEDCAECFTGLGSECYLGNPVSDLRFFSFGMIKTATALGGGVAIFREAESAKQIQRLQQLFPKRQTTMEFLLRIVLSGILNFIGMSPIRVGLLAALCSVFGMSFDKVVTSAVRGFRIANPPTSSRNEDQEQRERLIQANLVRQIRKQPSQALLSLLLRRFQQSRNWAPSVPMRLKRCQRMETILQKTLPDVLIPNTPNILNTHWSFPIRCTTDRDLVSKILAELGFDVVSGASQLCCISSYANCDDDKQQHCPRSEELMNSILYLPVASQHVSERNMSRLAHAISQTIDQLKDEKHVTTGHLRKSSIEAPFKDKAYFALAAIPLFALMTGQSIGPISLCQGALWLFMTIVGSITTILLIAFAGLHVLRWSMASFYLNGSSSFAEHCDMIDEASSDESRLGTATKSTRNNILASIAALEIPARTAGNTGVTGNKVILTGATGFVGSLLLRDLLSYRERLSIGRGVIVICRRKGKQSTESRIAKLMTKPMFSFLSEVEKRQLVEVIEGDVTKPSAGLREEDLQRICQDASISHVFHCAAAVSFTQDLPEAARANITSSLNMQSLTARLKSKNAQFVHISTAFVHGNLSGSSSYPLPEVLAPLGPFEPAEIYRSMLGTQFYATKAMSELRFHNSYTFSKCICEHLLLQQNDINTLVIRPSIVGPAVQSPFEGWAGEKPSTIVAGACLHLSHQWNLWYLEPQPVPCIPVDVLSRCILAKAFREAADSSCDTASFSEISFEKISRNSDTSSESEEVASASCSSTSTFRRQVIFNAAWDTTSNNNAVFTWLEFSIAYLHLGCVLGYFERSTAYLTLLVSARMMTNVAPTSLLYDRSHSLLIRWPTETLIKLCDLMGYSTREFSKVLSFLDLPLLFFPFVKNSFHFQSDLIAPECFNPKRYLFSCGVAAHRFISAKKLKGRDRETSRTLQKLSALPIGGSAHIAGASDLWWALSQPRGNYLVRFVAFLFSKVLRAVCSVVTVDATSFRSILSRVNRTEDRPIHLILAPTHRSFFDFILLSYVFFALPELQMDIPFIVAADEFEHLPVIGWVARLLRAVYIQRGRGYVDPTLTTKLACMKGKELSVVGSCLEVFLEGKRSRDRRFVNPKTGFLKSLKHSGGKHVIIPITINYEGLPEQRELSEEAAGTHRRTLKINGLFVWLKAVVSGNINIGRIHIAASDPLSMTCDTNDDFKSFADEVQKKQQELVCISDYHVHAASELFHLDPSDVREAMMHLGCKLWPVTTVERLSSQRPQLPTDPSDLLTIVLQMSHKLAPLFFSERREWSNWLNRAELQAESHSTVLDGSTQQIYAALLRFFDTADAAVSEAIEKLRQHGFLDPKPDHVFQAATMLDSSVPPLFLRAAATMRVPEDHLERTPSAASFEISDCNLADTQEKLGFWGFHDSGFQVKTNQRSQRIVTMKGSRYNISGRSLTKLLPFIESEMQVRINPQQEFNDNSSIWSRPTECNLNASDQKLLRHMFSRVSISTMDRIRHGTGHSQEDVYLIRNGDSIRIPDAVVWPSSEQDVEELVIQAKNRGWCLIPFGGGTNVSNATRCPTEDVEKRPIISVDMKDMCRILWLNEEDGLAHIEAGITGRQLVEELDRRGYTMGHEPDSIEFSTLGGWIATKASGMKRSKYGNIEDIVKSIRVVGSDGLLWKGADNSKAAPGRVAEGLDVRSLVMGSEGCLGIITSAVIRICPLPEVREYDSILLPTFEDGMQFMRSVSRLGRNVPSCVRLLDNAHFRLGQVLRPDDSSIWHQLKATAMKLAASAFGDFESNSVVCATISYEGSSSEVKEQKVSMKKAAGMHGGLMLGPDVGRSGYELTYMIAYLRDFAMTHHLLGESFETFVPWSKIESLIAATKERIVEEHKSRFLPGVPYIGCRITQLYHEGACLYFYLCISFDGVENASEVFAALEHAAREEILRQGGSLSHHHGIGKLRAPLLKGRSSPAFDKTVAFIKESVDKDNIFGARNGQFADCP